MPRWLLVLLCSNGGVVVGALVVFCRHYDTAGLRHVFVGAPVIKVADFLGRLVYHDPGAAVVFFFPVAVVYWAIIGAVVGFGLSFLVAQRNRNA